jgi:hypothetical protein
MAKDIIGMSIRIGADNNGVGGTSVPLDYSSVAYSGDVLGDFEKTPLQLILASAKRRMGDRAILRVPNPDYLPLAPVAERGEQYLVTEFTEAQCLTLVLRGRLDELLADQIQYMKQQASQSEAASLIASVPSEAL